MQRSEAFVHNLFESAASTDDADLLTQAETATFRTSQRVPVILRPQSSAEVQECVREANLNGIPLYPISSGKNWGYGSRVPPSSGCALLDLSALNRIVDFDESLGYVTVEPGVTQRQLYAFLLERRSALWLDATGSSPDCSLIGNALERGYGHTPYGDHFANVCGLEVILPDGEKVSTGFAGLPGARAAEVHRWGCGPVLDGLFSQSNFGIVTRMTIWLMPRPEYFQAYFFQAPHEGALAEFIEAIRPLRMNGTLRSTVHVANDYKVLNGIQQFPAGEAKPLMPEKIKEYAARLKFGRWNGSGALYGTRRQVAEARRLLRAALKGKATKLQFLDDRMLAVAKKFTRPYRWVTGLDLAATLALVRPVFGLLKGVPTTATLSAAYWRKSIPVPADPNPDRDRCGLIWCAPVAPASGEHVSELVRIAESTLLAHGFEPLISLTMITERSVAGVISIAYDRDVPGEDERAMACYFDAENALASRGYYPYRRGIQSMTPSGDDGGRAALLRKLKDAVDPNHILAPGRYLSRGLK